MHKLPRAFYNRETVLVAKELLGKYLIHVDAGVKRIGKIVEVEAYIGPKDLACHSAKGLTKRTAVMFGPPGYAYIYLIYGMYYCMNIVTEAEGKACAVLVRAIQPIQNIEGKTKGPGLLCQSMGIDKRLNGWDLTSDEFYVGEESLPTPFKLVKKSRIGIAYAKHWARRLLRFYIKNNSFISRP